MATLAPIATTVVDPALSALPFTVCVVQSTVTEPAACFLAEPHERGAVSVNALFLSCQTDLQRTTVRKRGYVLGGSSPHFSVRSIRDAGWPGNSRRESLKETISFTTDQVGLGGRLIFCDGGLGFFS